MTFSTRQPWRGRTAAIADAVLSTLGCLTLTVLLLAWSLVVTPIAWIVRTAQARS